MTLDDLKNININDLASWPVPVKIGGILAVCVVILFAGFWFLIQDELDVYGVSQKKEVSLRETYTNKVGMAVNLQTYKSHGVYVVPTTERTKVELLCGRYGINVITDIAAAVKLGDVGTSGTS